MKLQGQCECERCKRNINGEAGTIVWSLGETVVEGLYCEHCMDRVMRVIVCPEKDEHWGRKGAGRPRIPEGDKITQMYKDGMLFRDIAEALGLPLKKVQNFIYNERKRGELNVLRRNQSAGD